MAHQHSAVRLENLAEEIYKFLWFPISSSSKRNFSMNLCLVALGIRAGYLVDSFSAKDGANNLQQLLTILRRTSPRFKDVRLVYSAEHEQYFFLNMSLTRERASSLSSTHQETARSQATTFVLLDRTESIVKCHFSYSHGSRTEARRVPLQIDFPSDVVQVIRGIAESSEDPIPLPEGLTAKTLIPLSGFLLEFPVSYLPASDDPSPFLSGVALDVYECVIIMEDQHAGNILKEHTLLKFSCPAHLGASCDTLAPSKVVEDLDLLFHGRLEKVSSCSLKINHSVITQDRVAL